MSAKPPDLLSAVLRGHWSHGDPREILGGLTVEEAKFRPAGAQFSIFQELLHLELCQRDILAVLAGRPRSLTSDEDPLWPGADGPPDARSLKQSIQAFLSGLEQARTWIARADETIPEPSWQQTPISRALQVIGSHNSYHLGRIALLRAMYRRLSQRPS